jgi:hypothetical protein
VRTLPGDHGTHDEVDVAGEVVGDAERLVLERALEVLGRDDVIVPSAARDDAPEVLGKEGGQEGLEAGRLEGDLRERCQEGRRRCEQELRVGRPLAVNSEGTDVDDLEVRPVTQTLGDRVDILEHLLLEEGTKSHTRQLGAQSAWNGGRLPA